MFRWIAKKASKALWAMSAPIRRPLRVKLDSRVERLVSDTIHGRMLPALLDSLAASDHRLARIEAMLMSANHNASAIAEELDLVLGGLSREVFRLQVQVEGLRSMIESDRQDQGTGLMLVAGAGEDEPDCRPMAQERSMVG